MVNFGAKKIQWRWSRNFSCPGKTGCLSGIAPAADCGLCRTMIPRILIKSIRSLRRSTVSDDVFPERTSKAALRENASSEGALAGTQMPRCINVGNLRDTGHSTEPMSPAATAENPTLDSASRTDALGLKTGRSD